MKETVFKGMDGMPLGNNEMPSRLVALKRIIFFIR
jgi:hypothetical protein